MQNPGPTQEANPNQAARSEIAERTQQRRDSLKRLAALGAAYAASGGARFGAGLISGMVSGFSTGLVAGLATGSATATAMAKTTWPQRPITLIVPWPAGGATDLAMRVMAEEVGISLGQPIIITNKPGAAGTLVAGMLKSAKPDGYTIGQLAITVIRHALMNKVDWNPLQDIAPVLQLSGTTFGIIVPSSSPFKSIADMMTWAQKNPGELSVGSTGVGSTPHLAMEEIFESKNLKYIHVPYKGTTDQMTALLKNEIMVGVNSTGFAPWVAEGKLRVLAMFSDKRIKRWPEVPTMKELGFANAVYNSPWGLAVPAGTDPEIIEILHQSFKKALFLPKTVELLDKYDQDPAYLSPLDYKKELEATQVKERKLLQRLGLEVN